MAAASMVAFKTPVVRELTRAEIVELHERRRAAASPGRRHEWHASGRARLAGQVRADDMTPAW